MKKTNKNNHLKFDENKVYDWIKWGKKPIVSEQSYDSSSVVIPNRFDFGGHASEILRNTDSSFDDKPNTLFTFKDLNKDEK